MNEIRFAWLNDESCDIYVDGNLIMNINHDDHGWTAMSDIEKAFTLLAKNAGWKVVTVWEEEE